MRILILLSLGCFIGSVITFGCAFNEKTENKATYTPVAGDYVILTSYQSTPDLFPFWYEPGQPGIPYSCSCDWVGKRCKVDAVVTYPGVGTVINVILATGEYPYVTQWPVTKCYKTL